MTERAWWIVVLVVLSGVCQLAVVGAAWVELNRIRRRKARMQKRQADWQEAFATDHATG